jgi:glycosyltransferase involved in cell wall biosynthesis
VIECWFTKSYFTLVASLNPRITCVVPTYKRPAYLDRALESIEKQTYEPFEVIVSDNFPTEETEKVVKKFLELGLPIRHLKNKSVLPAFDNWMQGFLSVETDWMKIVWDDDWLEPTCLEELARLQVETDADVVLCGASGIIHGEKYVWYQQPPFVSNVFMELFPQISRRMYPNSPLAGIQKTQDVIDAMRDLKYPTGAISPNLVVGPDLAICFWGFAKGGKLAFTPKPLVNMFGDGENMTLLHEQILPRYYAGTLKAMAKHFNHPLSRQNRLLLFAMSRAKRSPSKVLGRLLYFMANEKM